MKKFMWICLLSVFVMLIPINLMAEDYMEQADVLCEKGGPADFKQAISLYQKALDLNAEDFELNWKCAKAYKKFGYAAKEQKTEGWKDICAEYGRKGMEYAKKAADLNPGRVEGHYYYGRNVGIYSDGVSILTAIRKGFKNKTQKSFEKAYEIDKMFEDASPIIGLGRLWSVLPWPFKDKKKALIYYREFQKTPYFTGNDEVYIYIAELLIAMGGKENKTEAGALLDKAVQSDNKFFRDWATSLLDEVKQ